jgi:hypothetical protein
MRKTHSIGIGAVCALMVTTGTAVAAGGGYGGAGANGGSTPAGFSAVSAVYSVNLVTGSTVGKGSVHLKVPKDATKRSLAVVFYKGNDSTAQKSATAFLKKKKVLTTFGVGLFSGPTAVTANKPITVTVTGSEIKPGEHLAVYSTRTHKFMVVPARFSKGKVTFEIERGQSVAIFS